MPQDQNEITNCGAGCETERQKGAAAFVKRLHCCKSKLNIFCCDKRGRRAENYN